MNSLRNMADGARLEQLHARILIVDDDERNAFAASSALADLGHEIIVARSGEDALRCLLANDYAVILLDLHMPGMDGYETAALIRQRQRTNRTPIVFLTAVFRDEAHLFQAYSAGAVDVVFKPVDPFILRSKVQVLVDLHLKTQAIQAQSEHRQRLLDENARVQREKAVAEKALRLSQERQRAILQALPVVLHSNSARPPYHPLFLSDNIENLTGFAARELIANPAMLWERMHPDDLNGVRAALSGALREGAFACEFRWLCADGEYRRFLDRGIVAPTDGDSAGEIFATLLDVTDQRLLEEQLVQARKMETVGQLTGGVAHDFNNLLTVIMGNVSLLGRNPDGDERRQRQLGSIKHAAERGQKLTRQLLAFSRQQQLAPEIIDVNALIGRFLPLVQQALSDSITVRFEPYEGDIRALVDPAQLENALLNLAVNARDAMPKGGVLSIRPEMPDQLPAQLRSSPQGQEAWIQITVADTGDGIPSEVLQRIFEPFFTTKEVGKGSGVGLSQVYGFAQQSGGCVTAENLAGGGACFKLFLRWSGEPCADAPVRAQPAPAGAATASVLVVEDDDLVRAMASEMLVDLGYRVSTAANASDAIEFIESGAPVEILFSDISMPGGQNGVDLARHAKKLRPDLKVLLSSGWANAKDGANFGDFDLIDKPYDPSDLAARLAALLAQTPSVAPQGSAAKPTEKRRARKRRGAPSSAEIFEKPTRKAR